MNKKNKTLRERESKWATPRASDGKNPAGMSLKRQELGRKPDSLHQQVNMTTDNRQPTTDNRQPTTQGSWPTPRTKGMCGGTGNFQQMKNLEELGTITDTERRQMTAGNGGKLNPRWVEWLMGWPLGWTALDAQATEWFRSKPRLPGKKSKTSQLKRED